MGRCLFWRFTVFLLPASPGILKPVTCPGSGSRRTSRDSSSNHLPARKRSKERGSEGPHRSQAPHEMGRGQGIRRSAAFVHFGTGEQGDRPGGSLTNWSATRLRRCGAAIGTCTRKRWLTRSRKCSGKLQKGLHPNPITMLKNSTHSLKNRCKAPSSLR
jgi:hypothetical protein